MAEHLRGLRLPQTGTRTVASTRAPDADSGAARLSVSATERPSRPPTGSSATSSSNLPSISSGRHGRAASVYQHPVVRCAPFSHGLQAVQHRFGAGGAAAAQHFDAFFPALPRVVVPALVGGGKHNKILAMRGSRASTIIACAIMEPN